jgi:glycosyltransferase involved in cell wall biosynthesis
MTLKLEAPAETHARTGVSVIIPVLNEEEAIGAVIESLRRERVDEIIIADGGSRDRTVAVAEARGARVIHAGKGYGRACLLGAKAAGPSCRILLFMDGDGADVTSELPRLVGPIAANTHDFVIASRARGVREPGAMAWHQLAAGRIIGALLGWTSDQHYTDMCAFRAIRSDALASLDMREMTYGWNLEMQMKVGYHRLRVLEVPVAYRRRIGGRSKVAGSLGGTIKAGTRILMVLFAVAINHWRGPNGQAHSTAWKE